MTVSQTSKDAVDIVLKQAQQVKGAIGRAKTVRICDLPSDIDTGWDAADAEAEGSTAKHVSRFLGNTTPVINAKAKVPVKPAAQKKSHLSAPERPLLSKRLSFG